ncbi:uncharacterized protein si:ch211-250c4.3 isoform X1 [Cyprinodon tularosa]|uniref:uncharacterized protein si:ch211-250c4.3 isoform X1 n=1 Tax=Cyprinodon tularosa TaxID=77115 RepID=UPI0018E24E64|nr:uncharacterized protein si:ch211-250c4.3 isoform X1 [Cyprinodon tularosa]XP_038136380.1 uncharacterized protein si:ch211-250c4.3 isoform X1 [Cyprinodon tularosa]
MSLRRKKAGLFISWQRSFSFLAPWRKGKEGRNAVLDSDVVLTKLKLISNFNEKPLIAEDPGSSVSTAVASEQDTLDLIKNSEVNSPLQDKPASKSLSAIFSDSRLSRSYKFESEDSGVELPSGANSLSTPTGSEKSFEIHSRESSCDSCNLDSSSNELVISNQNSDNKQAKHLDTTLNTAVGPRDNVFDGRDRFEPSAPTVKLYIGEETGQGEASGFHSEDSRDQLEQCEEMSSSHDEEKPLMTKYEDRPAQEQETETMRRTDTRDSLDDYMDTCCRLTETQQQISRPLGPGLGYLHLICQLLEKICHQQEINIQLQRQVCVLQKDSRMTTTKEQFFQQYCSCGAAILAFQNYPPKSDSLSPSGTFSNLSTIPEVSWSTARRREDQSAWRRTFMEEQLRLHGDDAEDRSPGLGRLGEIYTWGRDLVRKTKERNQSRLGLTPASLKLSCPQLYRPVEEHMDKGGRSRSSMAALDHRNKPDLWL